MNALPFMVILEGPDGAGKSTLATALVRLTGFKYTHFTAPAQGVSFDDTCRIQVGEVHASGESVLFDRFHLSERVYGPIARGVDTMSDDFEQSMWGLVRPVVVLCLPPWETAYTNWAQRNAERAEMIVKRSQYEAVYLAYESIRTTLPVLQYDYTRDSVVDLYNRLTVFAFGALSATPR